MKEQTPPFIYFYRSMRGPGIGCQPDGFDPDTRKSGTIDTVTPFGIRTFWGVVEYPTALHPRQIYKYELWPADDVQFAIWKAWEEAGEVGSLWVFESYREAILGEIGVDPEITLLNRFAKDTTAIIVKILLENGISIKELDLILA